jgi:hypothetical protein
MSGVEWVIYGARRAWSKGGVRGKEGLRWGGEGEG